VQFGEVPDACDVTLMPRGKFRSSKSHPRGSGYYLGWTATDDSLPKAAARRQAKAWLELLVDVPGVSSTSPIQDLWAIGNSRRLLTRLLKKHNAKRNKTVASADSIRARYHEALDAAETVVHASEAAVDELCEAEEKAQAEVWDAESFAEDPWGSMTHLAVTAAEIRQARERAANAELLLVQAGEKLKATQEALAVAETEWLGALRRYEHLRADPPAQ
jgi:hypothetical protein